MHVLLDTNIYMMDLTFSKPEHEALKNYLSMTNSRLLLPEIISNEVYKNIETSAMKELRTIKGLYGTRVGLIPETITVETVSTALKERFDKFAEGMKVFSIDNKNIDLQNLIDKSLVETPPFKSQGRGFRDALIWESLLKYLNSTAETQVAFITNNSNDFGKNELKLELHEELVKLNVQDRVHFFNSLGEFLTEYGESIGFITYDFIYESIEADVDGYAGTITESDIDDVDYPSHDYEWEVTGIDYEEFEIDNYYIYNATSTHYYVYAEVAMSFYVSLEGTRDEYDYRIDDFEIESTRDHVHAYKMVEYEIKIDKKTQEAEIVYE